MNWPWEREKAKLKELQERIAHLEAIKQEWEQLWERRNSTIKSQPNYHITILLKNSETLVFDSATSWKLFDDGKLISFIMPWIESHPYGNEYVLNMDNIASIRVEAIPTTGE